jgi:hypothetical protein
MPDQVNKTSSPSPLPPEETSAPSIKPLGKVAGGIPAIISTLKVTSSAMGLFRGVRTLFQINSSQASIVRDVRGQNLTLSVRILNSVRTAQSMSRDEATTKRVTPEFFKQWSVADLSLQSDQWLGAQGRILIRCSCDVALHITNQSAGTKRLNCWPANLTP